MESAQKKRTQRTRHANNMHESCEVKGHMLVELQQHIDKKRQEQQLLVREIQ
jgi:hypothetical protein